MRKVVVLCLICLLSTVLCMAQSTTDGAIGGTVFDKTGAVVGSAKIVVHNNGTNAEQTATSDASGYYRIPGLQPGTYTVNVTAASLAPYKAERVVVEVGSLTEVSPRLDVSGRTETVEVTAEAPQINYTSPDFANTLNQTAIANLPINGGRWSSFAILTPTVVSNSAGFGLLSFRGISTLLNNNTVDGADNNQAFFSEERGRTRIGYSTPMEAVEEFQVNTSNYSSEYGRSAGGVVNTVTKSGTNAFHGAGFFFDRDNVWGAANEFTAINVQTAPGVFSPVNFKPTDWRKRAGFGVGGPLIKDKVFFYVTYDWFHRNFPGTAVASNPNVFFATPSASTITTLAARLGVTTAQATTIYNNDLAGLNTMLGPVPRFGAQNIFYPKIDWTINNKNHASFAFNRMRWNSPAGIQTQATNTFGTNSFGNDFVKDTWGVAKLDSMITNNFANELRFQYGRDFEFEFAQPPSPYEVANLTNTGSFTNPLGLPPQVSITNGFTFGVPTFLQRPAFPDETTQQYADTMTWTHGKHSMKFGIDYRHINDISKNLRTQFGSYSYSSLLNYFSDLNKPNTCSGAPCYSSYQQAFGPLGFQFNTNEYSIFAQDDYKILPRLSISLGMRYEFEKLPTTILGNPAAGQTQFMPSDKNNWGPRVGFSAQLTGDGKTVLRAGYGVYYSRVINSTIFNALVNTGMPGGQNSFFFTPTTAGAPTFPQILSAAPVSTAKPSIAFFGNHFQNPQIQQFDLVLERDLGWGTTARLSYLGSLGRELPGFADINIAPSTKNITYTVVGGGPLGVSTLTEPEFTARVNPNFGTMTDIFSGINSRYDALAVQIEHKFSHNMQFSVNYTRARSQDFGQNESTFTDTNDLFLPGNVAGEQGRSIYDVPNRFVMAGVFTSPWKRTGLASWFVNDWQIAPIYQIQDGLPFTLRTSGTPSGGALGSSVNGSGGDNRIDAVGRNTFRLPGTWVSDLRLAKFFTFRERYKLELSGDFFNIANKQNVTSVNTTGYIISGTTLTFNTPFGIPNNSNSNFAYTPRQVQLGARVQF